MNHFLEIANAPWAGGDLATYGIRLAALFAIAVILLSLSYIRHPRIAHFARWFLWLVLLQGLVTALEALLDRGFLTGRPSYVQWLITAFQEVLMVVFFVVYFFRYRKAYSGPLK